MKHFTTVDLYGNVIGVDDNVIVPDPNDTDLHQHSFTGNVKEIKENGNVIVEDGDWDCFEIEGHRLILDNE